MKKTIYLSKKIQSGRADNEYAVPAVRFLNRKWREDFYYYIKADEDQFLKLRKKEGFLIS